MNFTSIDPPQVIRFVRTQYPDVVTHAPEKSIFALAVDRGILPSMRIRWCCADLKETAGAGKVTLIGIRKQESVRRAKRHEVEVSNRKFSGSLDEFEVWQKEQIEKKEQKLIRKMRKEGKKVNEDEFSLQTDNEVRCINGKDSILISPIFEWTEQDVWYFLNEVVKVPHCELYDQGYKRIGCILCPMSPYKQKVKEMKDFPHVKRGWIKAIKEIRRGGYFTKDLHGGTSERTGSSTQRTTGSSSTGCQRNSNVLRLAVEVSRRKEITPPPMDGQGAATQRRQVCGVSHGNDSAFRGHQAVADTAGRSTKTSSRRGFYNRRNLPPKLEQEVEHGHLGGFSGSPSAGGVVDGQNNSQSEDEIAEMIFDWWISGKSYSKWYADKFLQTKIEFND